MTHRQRTRRRIPNEHVETARELIQEAHEDHRFCCTLCRRCVNCGYPCLTARMAVALCQLTTGTSR